MVGGQWENCWFMKTLSWKEAAGDFLDISEQEYLALFAGRLEGYEEATLHNERKVEIWLKEHNGFVYYAMDLVKKVGSNVDMVMVPTPKPGQNGYGEREMSFMRSKGLSQGCKVGFRWDGDRRFLIFCVFE